MTRARERLLLSGALELAAALLRGRQRDAPCRGWRRRSLGDLAELAQPPPGAASAGVVLEAAAGGEPCAACWRRRRPQPALLAAAPAPAAERAPASAGAGRAPAAPRPAAPAPAPGRAAGVHPAQLTFEDVRRAGAGGARCRGVGGGGSERRRAARARRRARVPRPRSNWRRQLLLAEGARAVRLPLLPGTGARHGGAGRGGALAGSPAGALDALSRGSLVHRVLELHDFAGGRGPDRAGRRARRRAGSGCAPAPRSCARSPR